jgi:hypothetical protein
MSSIAAAGSTRRTLPGSGRKRSWSWARRLSSLATRRTDAIP